MGDVGIRYILWVAKLVCIIGVEKSAGGKKMSVDQSEWRTPGRVWAKRWVNCYKILFVCFWMLLLLLLLLFCSYMKFLEVETDQSDDVIKYLNHFWATSWDFPASLIGFPPPWLIGVCWELSVCPHVCLSVCLCPHVLVLYIIFKRMNCTSTG